VLPPADNRIDVTEALSLLLLLLLSPSLLLLLLQRRVKAASDTAAAGGAANMKADKGKTKGKGKQVDGGNNQAR
jgi:hypothetical protein